MHQTTRRAVNHAVDRLDLGTRVIVPLDHVVSVAELDDRGAAELGPLLRDTSRVVEAICQPEQAYVWTWSHGPAARKHLHILVQPITAALVAAYGGLRAEQLQARILASGDPPDAAEVERFCAAARQYFLPSSRA